MGVRRPEFGPPASEVEARLRGQLGIRMENGQPTYRPTAEQKQFLKEQLAARGLPTKQLDNLKYVRGLDKDAGPFTRVAFADDDTEAVTQGATVSVKPEKFLEFVGFNDPKSFEEAYHSGQFASDGEAGYYSPYLLNAIGGWLSTGDEYYGNPYESFAQGAARKMHGAYRHQRLQKGK